VAVQAWDLWRGFLPRELALAPADRAAASAFAVARDALSRSVQVFVAFTVPSEHFRCKAHCLAVHPWDSAFSARTFSIRASMFFPFIFSGPTPVVACVGARAPGAGGCGPLFSSASMSAAQSSSTSENTLDSATSSEVRNAPGDGSPSTRALVPPAYCGISIPAH
jgi:hypothetical protein